MLQEHHPPAPDVSVVVPVLNSSFALKQCLEALAAQKTTRRFEVVVVDDGSTEDLHPVRDSLAGRLTMRWERLPVNQGPATARNCGILAARGNLVLFTDADCRPEPQWLESLSRAFDDPNVSGAKGTYRTDQRNIWARLSQLEFEERYECLQQATDIDFIDTYSGAFRREDLLAVNGFDEKFPKADNEDVDLSFRIKKRGGTFVFVPGAVVWHRHREGLCRYVLLKFGRGYWRMRVYRKHPDKAGRDSYTPWSMKAQMLLLLFLLPALFSRRFRRLWLAAWTMTCLPQLRIALRFDPLLTPLVPVFHLVRDLALVLGIITESKDFHVSST